MNSDLVQQDHTYRTIDIDLENNYSKIFDDHKLILHDRKLERLE
jgi:hypothetical protein